MHDRQVEHIISIMYVLLMHFITFLHLSCGGNFLLNAGPTHDGRIAPIFAERLKQMGELAYAILHARAAEIFS